MQREIKFRGQRVDTKEWVYGYPVKAWDETCYIITEFGPNVTCCDECGANDITVYEVIPETIGQYTGLNDKNSKEIYEDDIVQFNNNKVDLCQVCFGEFPVYDIETEEVTDTTCGWYAKVIFTDALSQIEPFSYDRVINTQWIGTLDIEVIGNIYDNPELAEVSE